MFTCLVCFRTFSTLRGLSLHISQQPDHPSVEDYYFADHPELVDQHFMNHRSIDPVTGCWNWNDRLTWDGYGDWSFGGVISRVHRVAYMFYVEAIDKDICVLHTCDNPKCFNPDHLWLGTKTENCNDRDSKGRTLNGKNHPNYGKILSQDLKNRISKGVKEHYSTHPGSMLGKTHSKETKKQIRNALLLNAPRGDNHYMNGPDRDAHIKRIKKVRNNEALVRELLGISHPNAGKKHSEERRRKNSENQKRLYKNHPEIIEKKRQARLQKRIYVCKSPQGVIYKVVDLIAFCKEHHLSYTGMTGVATGRRDIYKGWACKKVLKNNKPIKNRPADSTLPTGINESAGTVN